MEILHVVIAHPNSAPSLLGAAAYVLALEQMSPQIVVADESNLLDQLYLIESQSSGKPLRLYFAYYGADDLRWASHHFQGESFQLGCVVDWTTMSRGRTLVSMLGTVGKLNGRAAVLALFADESSEGVTHSASCDAVWRIVEERPFESGRPISRPDGAADPDIQLRYDIIQWLTSKVESSALTPYLAPSPTPGPQFGFFGGGGLIN